MKLVSFITFSSFLSTSSHGFVVPLRRSFDRTRLNAAEPSLMGCMSEAVAKSLGRDVELQPASGAGAAGGGGASVAAAVDANSGDKYFIKSAPLSRGGGKMLRAEYLGIKEMAETSTIRVPKPIAYGEGGPMNSAFVVFEFLEIGGGGSGYDLGVQLAKMHRSFSKNGYGFHVDNTIGATPQPNAWMEDWVNFWDTHRLGHMLKLTDNCGFNDDQIQKLRAKTREVLSEHNPEPSLLHGDLWGGNKGFANIDGERVPVIFDPATYYGDRETDIGLTYLFGGFASDFYDGYESEWPLPAGHEKRRKVYDLYHILNHVVLFGGGYGGQAKSMIKDILRY